MHINNDETKQASEWDALYAKLESVLRRFGNEDYLGRADYWLLDDDWGCWQQKLYVNNLNMLAPGVISALQASLSEFPDWEIVVAVAIEGAGKSWPDMGITIRPHEIVDNLQRQYFPKEFQGLEYERSHRGVG
ncbi:MAG: hypothetical protein HYX37_19700 [Rhizobiales bacterium]|nr:hypothetical protein [Hyphomicrobiales bacterium]